MNEKFVNLLDSGIRNIAQAFHDNFVEANAKFRAKAGLKVTIVRESIGECCSWCSDLTGTYSYDNAPEDIYARHLNCSCVVSTKTEKGTWQDAWNKREYKSYRENRIAREREILETREKGYYGTPKTWIRSNKNLSADEILRGTNPLFKLNPGKNASKIELDYNLNCTNCVPAYEMRCRGYYDITAQPLSKNGGLAKDPFLAWENAKPITAKNGAAEIAGFVMKQEEGARIQIATKLPYSIWNQGKNHTFVAVKENGKCIFKDPQSGVIIKDTKKYLSNKNEIRYLKINDLEISDKGISACKITKQ